jgi:prolipoprotein diacylglyceryl transferase
MVWKGGLASHGAAIGIIISMYFYSKNVVKESILWMLDRVVITVALAGFFIRMGNLFNHEIIGLPTELPWGFIFNLAYVPDPLTPRHPAQLYEAICYLLIFVLLYQLFWKKGAGKKPGFLFGLFLVTVFTARFIIEFIKENQVAFEDVMALNMGQWLSIPAVLGGLFFVFRSLRVANK